MTSSIPEVILEGRVPNHMRAIVARYDPQAWLQGRKAGMPDSYVYELYPEKAMTARQLTYETGANNQGEGDADQNEESQ